MAEKSKFSDLVKDTKPPAPDEKCCYNCAHGRLQKDPRSGSQAVKCKAGPPSAQAIANSQLGPGTASLWPILPLHEECDEFFPKTPALEG